MIIKKYSLARLILLFGIVYGFSGCAGKKESGSGLSPITISANRRFFATKDGRPFFWQGDTGWLLFGELNDEDTRAYLADRKKKGFNVIQVMLIHSLSEKDVYGDSALTDHDLSRPRTGSNNDPHNYWNHVDKVVGMAAKDGIYIALVPVWGTVVKSGKVSVEQAKAYAKFLAYRYKDKPNIIWINGGDIQGSDSTDIWQAIGETLHKNDPDHLITFHPRGRTISSLWFHNADWLAFNTFQSGHRRYDQDTSKGDFHFGEDNYKYVEIGYNKTPAKPVLDAEPSYENIPQGLHDTAQPRWKAADIRRYAYWSVFAGACGFTYGDNSVMQFHHSKDKPGAYGATEDWTQAINDTGASQMVYLKQLMLSRDYFSRVPDQSLVADQGKQYQYIAVTRGRGYVFAYDYTGRTFSLNLGSLSSKTFKVSWYDPRTGKETPAGKIGNNGILHFDPPGDERVENDWVLILDYI